MNLSKLYFGADYYPEHWPEERWINDAKLMKGAGFNVVRMAEFAWSKLEPKEGEFDFAWLDRAIAILSTQGIQVVLGTPTASPPPWLMFKDESLFLVNEMNIRTPYGFRRGYCVNHPLYYEHTEKIVRAMGRHYGQNTDVIGWQIDNEFRDRCYCRICRGKFHEWLHAKYGTLEKLNSAWGTDFWSHHYTEWSEIPVPLKIARAHNPGLHLDYLRFMSDSFRSYQKYQIDILQEITEDQFVTHNLMGFGFDELNYYDNAEDLDFVSWDNYKRMQWDMHAKVDHSSSALSADTMRGLKKKNFWVMEQQSGSGGWDIVPVSVKPGELRLWTYQAIAHGADGLLYFRWRTCRFGTEQYWHGILDHHGIPGQRYEEVSRVGRELEKIGKLVLGSEVRSKVAIMQSYDTRFAFQVQPNNPRFKYESHIHDIYRAFFNHNIPVDIISEKETLENYALVVVPALYVLSEETAANLESFAEAGGTVVFTSRTGVKDMDNKVVNMKLPGLAARMAGVEVDEYISMPVDEDGAVVFHLPDLEDQFSASVWADVLHPLTAIPIATYNSDFYSGQAAATINDCKDGKVIYLGTMGDTEYYDAVIGWILGLVGISPILDAPDNVEVYERWQGDQCLLFLLNYDQQAHEINLGGVYQNILNGEEIKGSISLPPLDLFVLVAQDE